MDTHVQAQEQKQLAPLEAMKDAPASTPQAQVVPVTWMEQALRQHLALQQSLLDAWQVWAWIPWNMSLSAWQIAGAGALVKEPPSGLLFSALGGHTSGFQSERGSAGSTHSAR